jgi:hypothetical protein
MLAQSTQAACVPVRSTRRHRLGAFDPFVIGPPGRDFVTDYPRAGRERRWDCGRRRSARLDLSAGQNGLGTPAADARTACGSNWAFAALDAALQSAHRDESGPAAP